MRALTTEELREVKLKRDEFAQLPRTPVVMVADNLTSGFNVGSLFRLADAFRIERLYLCGTTPQPPQPRIRKTSMGSEKWVEWRAHSSASEVVSELHELGYHTVAIELTASSTPLPEFHFHLPLTMVVGDELAGISPAALAACEASVSIPMWGMGNSINVVTAAAIVIYQMSVRYTPSPIGSSCQRRTISGGPHYR
ncbi:MAG: TrmH family RNA methyltransferase [Candidatus Dormibacteraceae bacterium]